MSSDSTRSNYEITSLESLGNLHKPVIRAIVCQYRQPTKPAQMRRMTRKPPSVKKMAYELNPAIDWTTQDREYFTLMAKAFSTRVVPAKSYELYRQAIGAQCPLCNMIMKKRGNLLDHLLIHTGETLFSCPMKSCRYKCIKSSHIAMHLARHTAAKPYKCLERECTESFATSTAYSRHYKSVHDKRANISLLWTDVKGRAPFQKS